MTFQLLGRRVSHHGRNAHPEPDLESATRHRVVRFLLIVDDLLNRRSTTPAPFPRPGDRGKARVGFLRLPFLRSREAFRQIGVGNVTASVRGLRGDLAFGVNLKETPDVGAESSFLGRVVEVLRHSLLRRVTPLQRGDEPILPIRRAANRYRKEFGPAIVEMTVGLPCEPDAAMRLDVLLRGEMEGVSRSDACGGAAAPRRRPRWPRHHSRRSILPARSRHKRRRACV
jgi:hypothetical protein